MSYQPQDFSRLLGTAGFSDTILNNHFALYGGYVTNVNKLSDNLNQASEEVKENVREIMERLSSLPFLSFFIKKHGARTVSKKRSQ